MKKFFLKTLSTVFASLFLSVVMFFSFISIHSGKFPPSVALAKEYIQSLAKARESYAALVTKSEKYIKSELGDASGNPGMSADVTADVANFEELNATLIQLKIQLNRIEQQNLQILRSMKK